MNVLDQLTTIRAKKEADKIIPTYAMLDEIKGDLPEIRRQVSALIKEGIVRVGKTINSYFIELL